MKCCIMSVLVMDNRARRICVQRTPPLQQRPGPRSPGQKTFADISYITYGRELAFVPHDGEPARSSAVCDAFNSRARFVSKHL